MNSVGVFRRQLEVQDLVEEVGGAKLDAVRRLAQQIVAGIALRI
jgi:hypothetical protein